MAWASGSGRRVDGGGISSRDFSIIITLYIIWCPQKDIPHTRFPGDKVPIASGVKLVNRKYVVRRRRNAAHDIIFVYSPFYYVIYNVSHEWRFQALLKLGQLLARDRQEFRSIIVITALGINVYLLFYANISQKYNGNIMIMYINVHI